MNEPIRTRPADETPSAAAEGATETAADSESQYVQVSYGLWLWSLPLAGRPVCDARLAFSEYQPVPPDAVPVLDGKRVDEDTILAAGQCLVFLLNKGCIGG